MGVSAAVSSEEQLQHLLYSLRRQDYNTIGSLTDEGIINHYVRAIWTHNDKPRFVHLINHVNQAFALQEQKGIKIFNATMLSTDIEAEKKAYQRRLQIYFKTSSALSEEATRLNVLEDSQVKKALHTLKRHVVALRYNLGSDSGGIEGLDVLEEPDPSSLKYLTQLTIEWKKGQELCKNKTLNYLEMKVLEEAARYPEWVALLKESLSHQNDFLKWAIRDYNPVEVFIKYFATQSILKASDMSSYLGYARTPGNEILKIQEVSTKVEGVKKKVLCLPFYDGDFTVFESDRQKWINILKPTNVIHFEKGNYFMTVDEFMKENGDKGLREINVNLVGHYGYANFHPIFGVWNADKRQYEELPAESEAWTPDNWFLKAPAMRFATHEEILGKYGDKIENKNIFFQVRSTRSELNLKSIGCHGFLHIYIKLENGFWKVVSPGVYAERYPQNALDAISMFGGTFRRTLVLMDQNATYTHRQRAAVPFFPSDVIVEKFLDAIYYKLLRQHGVFQLGAINCAYGVQDVINSSIDARNYFKMDITGMTTGNPIFDPLLRLAKRISKWMGDIILWLIHQALCSNRSMRIMEKNGLKTYSLNNFLSTNGYIIHNPSYIFKQIEDAHAGKTEKEFLKNGELSWGNTEERIPIKKEIVINEQQTLDSLV